MNCLKWLTAAQEKLEQEEANTRMNMQKIDAQGRAILRKGRAARVFAR